MNVTPLSRLFESGRAGLAPVAFREGAPLSFNRFLDDVRAVAASCDARPAALVCEDSYNFLVGLFGLLHAGAIVIFPPNTQVATLHGLREVFEVLIDDRVVEGRTSARGEMKPLDAMRPSLHFFTSGSTGTPKCVIKTLAMFDSEMTILEGLWGNSVVGSQTFATVPHHHIYGLTFKLLWPLATGRSFDTQTHVLWEALLARLPPRAVLVSSPAHLSRLEGLMALERDQAPVKILSAGAPLSLAAVHETKEIFGCTPTEIFGSTETGAIATRCQDTGLEPWSLLPGLSMRCAEDGRMVLRSPMASPDWIVTEDLVEPVTGGFHFRGRADRIVKVEEKRVSLIHVEKALSALPAVQDAAVILSSESPARLSAAVVLTAEGQARLAKIGSFRFSRELRSELEPALEKMAMPRRWRFVNHLPTGALGKRRDSDIAALFTEVK